MLFEAEVMSTVSIPCLYCILLGFFFLPGKQLASHRSVSTFQSLDDFSSS